MKKLLVVTGGTKGIGRAIIYQFAQNGFDIITCARNEQELAGLQKEINERFPGINVNVLKADLSVRAEVASFADFVKKTGSGIDVLVNNAGVFIPGQSHTEEEGILEKLIQTNLYSAYHLTRSVAAGMIKRKSGYIFNICSTASIMPYINGGSYCISKYALYGFTKVLREEMKAYQVKVTAVLPGATLTASWEGSDLPPERFIKAEDVASTIFNIYTLSGNTVVEEVLIRPQLGDI